MGCVSSFPEPANQQRSKQSPRSQDSQPSKEPAVPDFGCAGLYEVRVSLLPYCSCLLLPPIQEAPKDICQAHSPLVCVCVGDDNARGGRLRCVLRCLANELASYCKHRW